MKKILPILVLTLVQVFVFAQSEQSTNSKVEKVTVFLNNASVTQSASASLPKGTSTLIVKDFPSSIDQNSIQVKGIGAFTLLSVAFEMDYLNTQTATLEDSIKILSEKIEDLTLDKIILEKEEKMLLANSNIKGENAGLNSADLSKMQAYFRDNLKRIGKEVLAISRNIKEVEKHKQALQNQLNVSKNVNQPKGQIILKVKTDNATKANLEITYMAFGCGWSPNYDIRVKDISSPANVVYKAKVYQNTGIDWKNVALTLSTSNPNKGTVKPEVFPQYLSIVDVNKVRFMTPEPVYDSEVRIESAPKARVAGMKMESMDDYVEMVETTLDINFKIDMPYTINSGKKAEEVEIINTTLPGYYNYYVVPKYDTEAFLIATLKDWEKYNFLPGAMNVYFEEAFVGKSYMPDLKADDELKISLGRDARIVAERKELTDFKSKKTFGSNIRETFSYRIEVKNNRSSAVKVFVEDQYPISQNSEIEVELKAGDASIDKEKGKLTWELNIPSKGISTKEFGYEVKYPKDKIINNL
ncbi:conserved hypothetical protein [Spirosomataceae bacterium TFI 002]|nr:conserved hypothetical protein [Spirosomataceae bacterium TFI 002]